MIALRKLVSVILCVAGVLAGLATFIIGWAWAIAHFVDSIQASPVNGMSIVWCVVAVCLASPAAYIVGGAVVTVGYAVWPARQIRDKAFRSRQHLRSTSYRSNRPH